MLFRLVLRTAVGGGAVIEIASVANQNFVFFAFLILIKFQLIRNMV